MTDAVGVLRLPEARPEMLQSVSVRFASMTATTVVGFRSYTGSELSSIENRSTISHPDSTLCPW